MAMVVLALTSRLERDWSRRGLAACPSLLGRNAAEPYRCVHRRSGTGAVCVVALAQRAWRHFAEAAVTAVVTAVGMLGVYEGFDARAVLPGLTFSPPFPAPLSPAHQWCARQLQVRDRAFHLDAWQLRPRPRWVAVPLFLAGLVTIFRLGRPVTALTLAALWPEMLITLCAAQVSVPRPENLHVPVRCHGRGRRDRGGRGVLTAAALAQGHDRRRAGGHSAGRFRLAGQALCATVTGSRSRTSAIRRVMSPRTPGRRRDPGEPRSNWGFAYYWPVGQPARRSDQAVIQEYEAYFPAQPRIVVAANRNSAGVSAAVSQAVAQQRRGTCARIWLVRTHVSVAEQAAWQAALRTMGWRPGRWASTA